MATMVDSPTKPARRDPTPRVAPWTLPTGKGREEKGDNPALASTTVTLRPSEGDCAGKAKQRRVMGAALGLPREERWGINEVNKERSLDYNIHDRARCCILICCSLSAYLYEQLFHFRVPEGVVPTTAHTSE